MFKKIHTILLFKSFFFITLFVVPFSIQAQTADFSYISSLSTSLTGIVDEIIPVLAGIALALFIWGLVVFIAHTDSDQERVEGRKKMVWGIIGLFVIVSVWGLVALVQEITGINDGTGNGVDAPGVPAP